MKLFSFLIYFILLKLVSYGQDFGNFSDSKIGKNDLKNFIKVLTSDSLLGRETGTIGQYKAADFISDRFKNLSLVPLNGESYIQSFNLKRTYWGEVYIKTKNERLENFVDMVYIGPDSENFEIEKEVVFGGNGTQGELKQIDVKDKIVLIFVKNLKNDIELSINLRKLNAYGLILANPDNDLQFETIRTTLKNFSLQKRFSLTKIDSVFKMKYIFRDTIKFSKTALIPNNRIKSILNISTKKLQEAILKNEIGKIPTSIIKIKYERIHDTINTSNVCGFIKGKSNKSIIISAHYDHLGSIGKNYFPGADDNASGTAALMEIAEEFSNCKDLNFNLVFLATTGEEEGLLGSKYFVSQDNFDPKNVICNLNMDMISRYDSLHESDQKYIYCIGTDNSKELNLIFQKAAKFYGKCSFDFSLDNTKDPLGLYTRSDQYAFYKKGVPSVFLFTGLHEDYHKQTDIESKINYSILENRVRLISVIIRLLQNEWTDK